MKVYRNVAAVTKIEFCCKRMAEDVLLRQVVTTPWTDHPLRFMLTHSKEQDYPHHATPITYCFHCGAKIEGYCLEKLASTPLSYQDRVKEEKEELDKKAKALSKFIGFDPAFILLHPDEQERLKVQNDIMWQYSEILGRRIDAFTE